MVLPLPNCHRNNNFIMLLLALSKVLAVASLWITAAMAHYITLTNTCPQLHSHGVIGDADWHGLFKPINPQIGRADTVNDTTCYLNTGFG